MRDIGLEDAAYQVGIHGERIQHMRWCHSLLGQEYARAYAWGSAPMTLVRGDVVLSGFESLILRSQTYSILLRASSLIYRKR
jgi:hypothetical protein